MFHVWQGRVQHWHNVIQYIDLTNVSLHCFYQYELNETMIKMSKCSFTQIILKYKIQIKEYNVGLSNLLLSISSKFE